MRIVSEDVAVVLPFRMVTVDGPGLTQLGDAESSEYLVDGAIEMVVLPGLGFLQGIQ